MGFWSKRYLLKNKKAPPWRGFLSRHRLDAFRADFFLYSVDFFNLQVDAEFSQSFNIRMTHLAPGLHTASANRTYFTHDHETWNMKHGTRNKICCMLYVLCSMIIVA